MFYNEWTELSRADLSYCVVVYPNGREADAKGYVKVDVLFDELPEDVCSVVVMLKVSILGKLQSDGAQSPWREIRSFKRPNIFTDDFSSIGNFKFSLKRESLLRYAEVKFAADVDILDVEYDEDFAREYEIERLILRPIGMDAHIEYEWAMDPRLLHAMKRCDVGKQFGSDSFGVGGNWSLYGVFNNNKGVDLGLRLLRLPVPNKVRAVNVDYSLEFITDSKSIQFDENADISYQDFCWCWKENTFSTHSFKACQSLTVYVTINVLAVFDHQERRIAREQWAQFGIL